MTTKPITKTETRRVIASARRRLALVTNHLTPTPAWIIEQRGTPDPTPEETTEAVLRALRVAEHEIRVLRERIERDGINL